MITNFGVIDSNTLIAIWMNRLGVFTRPNRGYNLLYRPGSDMKVVFADQLL
jgi:hypothetical protein